LIDKGKGKIGHLWGKTLNRDYLYTKFVSKSTVRTAAINYWLLITNYMLSWMFWRISANVIWLA